MLDVVTYRHVTGRSKKYFRFVPETSTGSKFAAGTASPYIRLSPNDAAQNIVSTLL
jgi:hypothetical protein